MQFIDVVTFSSFFPLRVEIGGGITRACKGNVIECVDVGFIRTRVPLFLVELPVLVTPTDIPFPLFGFARVSGVSLPGFCGQGFYVFSSGKAEIWVTFNLGRSGLVFSWTVSQLENTRF